MTRRSKEQRRTDYLDIGAAIVAESAKAGAADPGLALAHVKLADVADRAGVTKGALYHIWPSQESFWHDLLAHLIDTNQLFGADQLGRHRARHGAASAPRRRCASTAMRCSTRCRIDPSFFARISLFSYLDDECGPRRARPVVP